MGLSCRLDRMGIGHLAAFGVKVRWVMMPIIVLEKYPCATKLYHSPRIVRHEL